MDYAAVAAAMVAATTLTRLVEITKDMGLPSKFAGGVCVVFGVALGAASVAITDVSRDALAAGAASGFVAGIGASATYAAAKAKVVRATVRKVKAAVARTGEVPDTL